MPHHQQVIYDGRRLNHHPRQNASNPQRSSLPYARRQARLARQQCTDSTLAQVTRTAYTSTSMLRQMPQTCPSWSGSVSKTQPWPSSMLSLTLLFITITDGGGHSVFGATYDPSVWMNTNDNGFIHVEMQYRLGAFGYLSSQEVKDNGVLNAGLLDQRFAIEWVQKHISKFGGDPERITIGGESSGAGSAMFHALAYGGRETNLFKNVTTIPPYPVAEATYLANHVYKQIIAASPYSPPIYKYNHRVPSDNYDAFAELAGCGEDSLAAIQHGSVFKCLVAADTEALQNASGKVSTTRGYFGSFAFLPVVDGDYIRKRPSEQLISGKFSGKNLLVGVCLSSA